MPLLNNWAIVDDGNPYTAPEAKEKYLSGNIYRDKRFPEGAGIRTSAIVELDIKNKRAQTRNTLYRLGNPDEAWLEWLKEHGLSLETYQQEQAYLEAERAGLREG